MRYEWKLVDGWPNYRVSKCGLVANNRTGYVLKQVDNGRGYLRVYLSKHPYYWIVAVHILVANAFLSPRPDGKEVNHKDGNKKNNHYTNLEWVTRGENLKHAYQLGLRNHRFGNVPTNAKLNEKTANEIRSILGTMTQRKIADRFGVSPMTITLIKQGKIWSRDKVKADHW